jgi:DNA-directed RNA polymerase subunit RPC12/RpoP
MPARKIPLKVVVAPRIGPALAAPPVLMASVHSVDYICEKCGTILLHADEDQVYGLLIQCKRCGSYNATGT